MLIRLATADDHSAIWSIIGPIIRAGETYTLDMDMGEEAAMSYWCGDDKKTFVAVVDEVVLGSYFIRPNHPGGGRHICNCGYMTASTATGQGIARGMCLHSLDIARQSGFRAMQFNFVVATNDRAIRLWESLDFKIIGRLPDAFEHPRHGEVDALIMHRRL
jgi:ribosomal protein S18 acetylase RimI-like enzyme